MAKKPDPQLSHGWLHMPGACTSTEPVRVTILIYPSGR